MKTDLLTDMRYCRDHGICDKCGHYTHKLDCIDNLLRDAAAEIERLRETVEKRDAEPVVRCGECKKPIEDCPFKEFILLKTDYCSYGERKDVKGGQLA